MRRHDIITPESLGAPKGFSHGVLAAKGRLLFVAGQIGWDKEEQLVSTRFAEQFDRALANLLAVVAEAGGAPEHVCRLTIFVTSKKKYKAAAKEVGAAYRARMGKHYPAMSLLEVADLLEDGAKVEIEATAVIPEGL